MVVIEIGDGQAQESRTSRMPIDTLNRPRLDCDYSCVPWEIWYEILSRLNIKSLFVCQVVCKIWKEIVSRVTKNIEPLPLCGLVLRKGLGPNVYVDAEHFHTTYICLTTKATLDPRELSIASGYEQGLITGLKFDFGALGAVNNPLITERKPTSLTSHKGLLLVDYSDGTYEVHNPVTRQVCAVPKSELFGKYGAPMSIRESCGLIINLSDRPAIVCSFVIVRFSRKFNKIEMYYSVTKRWSVVTGLQNVVRRARWSLENYVAIYKTQTLSFYFLTDAYHGVVSNFRNLNDPEATSFAFPLPNSPLLHWNDGDRRIIWESEKNVLLSYCDPTGLKIWKAADSTRLDETWAWIPQLEISNTDPLRNVAGSGREDIVKLLNAGGRLKPIAFHPYVPIMYLLVEENIFGYDLVNDTLIDIAKINDVDLFKNMNVNAILGYPFIPCIASFVP